MKRYALIVLFLSVGVIAHSQNRYFTRNGGIHFSAGTAMEDIDAVNNSVTSVMDLNTGQIEFAVLIKGFEFKRALMEDHFNENYLESDKYPRAIFKGKFTNRDNVNITKDGEYPIKIRGVMDLHGVRKEIETDGVLAVTGSQINARSKLNILLSDYNINIPSLVKDKISKVVSVSIDCNYSELR